MRARVRRGRRTSVVAATETRLAPVDVAGASAERFSFITYLISTVHCKLHFSQQRTSACDARSSQLPVFGGCFTETRFEGNYDRTYIYAVAKTSVTKNCRSLMR